MDKNKLIEYCDLGLSSYSIANKENISQTSVRYWLNKYNLKTKGWFRWDEKKLRKTISESKSYNEVLLKLGKSTSSNNYRSLKRAIVRFKINVEHFMDMSEIIKLRHKQGVYGNKEIFVKNSSVSRTTVRRKILKDGLLPYICVLCGQDDKWNGKEMTLILDHINGINNDHRLENLRFVCPNCNATLPTHCRNNKT